GMTSSLVEIALKSQCSYSYANTKVSFQRVTLAVALILVPCTPYFSTYTKLLLLNGQNNLLVIS
ncbi:MAG: hypothetical protein ACEY3M_04795, partial [Wolbachia sp.]